MSDSAFYDASVYAAASKALAAGDLESALRGYCDMFRVPKGARIWTLSVVLVCDASQVPSAIASVSQPQPVFVQTRLYKDKTCFRICAGLTTDREEAARWRILLPEKLRAEGAFPVRVSVPCDPPPGPVGSIVLAGPRPSTPSVPPEAPPPAAPPEVSHAPPTPAIFASPSAAPAAATPVPAPPAPDRPATALPAPVVENPSGASRPANPYAPPVPLASRGDRTGVPPALPEPAAPGEGKRAEAEAWFQKGVAAQAKGHGKEAVEAYNRALQASPERPEVLNNLGVIYLQQNRYEEARQLFDRAISRSPSYARAHLNLAGALWGLGQRTAALDEARIALGLDASDVSGYLTLASFLLATGHKEEAADQARRALLLDPGNAQARAFLSGAPEPSRPGTQP